MTMSFFAAVSQKSGMVAMRIRTTRSLQDELSRLFKGQANEFLSPDLHRIPFEGRYKADEHELFLIPNFTMCAQYLSAAAHPQQCDDLILKETAPLTLRSLFAAEHDPGRNSTTIWFQAFNRSHLLVGGCTILLRANTYQKLTEAGLTFDSKLAALYQNRDLLFRSYSTVKSFVDVSEYFHEATDEEISSVLLSPSISCPDSDRATVLKISDEWMRRRFTAVKASGILEKVTAKKIANRAKKFGLVVQVTKEHGRDLVVFPSDKKEAKRLLNFLNEGFYVGVLTGTLYQSNSQIPLPTPPSRT